jgi:hypothetical protein
MPWIDFKSGFALVGSLMVLVGSIVTRRNSMRGESGPEGQGEPAVPVGRGPDNPKPVSPVTFSTVVEHPFKALKQFSFKKRPPPTGAA